METIFKVGDRVYDGIMKLWGTVKEIDEIYSSTTYPITVLFDNDYYETYTHDGKRFVGQSSVLSFTEYDLVNGGFSQTRPLPIIKKDQLIYIKYDYDLNWRMRFFSHIDKDGNIFCFVNQQKSTETSETFKVNEYSIENPLK